MTEAFKQGYNDYLMKIAGIVEPGGPAAWLESAKPVTEAKVLPLNQRADPLFGYPSHEGAAPVDDLLAVNDFHNRVRLPMKREFGGVPGKDYDATYWRENFPLEQRFYGDASGTHTGYVSPASLHNSVHLNMRPTDSLSMQQRILHETEHNLNRDAPFVFSLAARAHSGASKNDEEKLNKVYKFKRPDSAAAKHYIDDDGYSVDEAVRHAGEEQFTTNAEHQLGIDKLLTENNHGIPLDYQSWKARLSELPKREIESEMLRSVNAYDDDRVGEAMIRFGKEHPEYFDKLLKDPHIQSILPKDPRIEGALRRSSPSDVIDLLGDRLSTDTIRYLRDVIHNGGIFTDDEIEAFRDVIGTVARNGTEPSSSKNPAV